MISRMLTTTMKRTLSVVKRVRQPSFVFHYARPQWKSIYSAQRAFCDKKGIRNGLGDSGDGVQVPQPHTIDNGLDSTGAGGQLSGENAIGTPDGNGGGEQGTSGSNDTPKPNGISGGSSNVYANVSSQFSSRWNGEQEKWDAKKNTDKPESELNEENPKWKSDEKFLYMLGIFITFGIGLVSFVYQRKQLKSLQEQLKSQKQQWTKENELTEGQISDKEANDILGRCVLDAFKNSKATKQGFFVDRSKTEAGRTILSHCSVLESGLFLLYGSKDIGKSFQLKWTYNDILKKDATTPILRVSFEKGLKEAAIQLNAFPPETTHFKPMPSNKTEAFEEATRMLVHQLSSEQYDFKQMPVLLIDSISEIPDDVFNLFGSQLKSLLDDDLIKVVILASNGASLQKVLAHKQLASRLGGKNEIINDFTLEEIEEFLENDKAYGAVFKSDKKSFSLIAEAMYRVGGGRVGYAKKLCKQTTGTAQAIIKQVKERADTTDEKVFKEELEEAMAEHLLDNYYGDIIVEAFEKLAKKGFDVDALICADLPNKRIGWEGVKILVHYNIIDTLDGAKFESEPLKRIFASEKLRQKIRKRMIENQLLKK